MDRRSFLKATTGSAALIAGLSGTALAGPDATPVALAPDARRLTVRADGTPDLPGPAASVVRMAGRLAHLSGGKLGLALVDGDEPADVECVWTSALVTRDPAFALFAGLPGASAAAPHNVLTWMAAGGGDALLDDLAEVHGFVARLAGHSGPHTGLWTDARAAGRDVRDLAVAASGLVAAMLTRMGGRVTLGDGEAAVAALQTRSVTAAEVGGALTTLALGLHARDGLAMASALQPAGETAVLVLPQDVWASLSTAEQAMITLVARDETWQSLAEHVAHQLIAAEVLAEVGIPRVTLAESGQAAFEAEVAAFVAEIADRDARAARIVASQRAVLGTTGRPRIA